MLRLHSSILCACVSLTLCGCGGRTVDEEGSSGENGSGEVGSSEAGSTSAETTTDPGTSTSSTGETDTGDTGGELCGPNAGARAQFSLTPTPDTGSQTCRLTDSQGPSTDLVYTFDCSALASLTLEISSTLPGMPGLIVGNDYVIRYEADPIFWVNKWMAIQLPNTESPLTLLGGINGDALVPPSGNLADFFGEPDFLTPPFECMAENTECGGRVEIPLEMVLESGARSAVWHGNSGVVEQGLGGFYLELESAYRNLDPNMCDDVPAQWFSLVFSRYGGD